MKFKNETGQHRSVLLEVKEVERGKDVIEKVHVRLEVNPGDIIELSEKQGTKLGFTKVEKKPLKEEKTKDKIEKKQSKPKWNKEILNEIYKKEGMEGLKKIGKKFNVTDRSSKKLITEILKAQG